jgi:hypothetical protein
MSSLHRLTSSTSVSPPHFLHTQCTSQFHNSFRIVYIRTFAAIVYLAPCSTAMKVSKALYSDLLGLEISKKKGLTRGSSYVKKVWCCYCLVGCTAPFFSTAYPTSLTLNKMEGSWLPLVPSPTGKRSIAKPSSMSTYRKHARLLSTL